MLAFRNFFQLRSNGDASATASQLIFDGSYLVGLQAAKTYRQLSEKSLEQTSIQVAENVSKAYYLALISEERIELLNSNISRLDTMLRHTRSLFENGFVEKIDVDRIEVSYNNLRTEKAKAENLAGVSRLLLKYQMGMPVSQEIILSDKIAQLDREVINAESIQADVSKRIEYSLLQTQKHLFELDRRNIRMGSLPRLAAFATGGVNRQDQRFFNLFSNSWYTYSMVGLNLSVPIFDGTGRYYLAQQSKLKLEKMNNSISDFENTYEMQMQQAKISLGNAVLSLQAQRRNMELAAEVIRVSRIKYQEGVGSNIEVINAETSFREAQTNYYNALFDALVAKIDMQIAQGSLVSGAW